MEAKINGNALEFFLIKLTRSIVFVRKNKEKVKELR